MGPVARHLAETVATGILRAGRAERLEGELLAGLAQTGSGLARSLHHDRDARASLALVLRYGALWAFSANFVALPDTLLGEVQSLGGLRIEPGPRNRFHEGHLLVQRDSLRS